MWNDPIVEETRKLRDEYAAQHGYDIHRIAEDLRAWERQGFPVTGLPPVKDGLALELDPFTLDGLT